MKGATDVQGRKNFYSCLHCKSLEILISKKHKQHFPRKPRNLRNVGRIFSFTFFIYLQRSGDAILLWHLDVEPSWAITQERRKIKAALFGL